MFHMSLSIELTAAAEQQHDLQEQTPERGRERASELLCQGWTPDSSSQLCIDQLYCSQQQCVLTVCAQPKRTKQYENEKYLIYKLACESRDLSPLLMINVIAYIHTHTHSLHTCNAHCVRLRRAPVNCYCTLHWKSMQLIMHLPIITTGRQRQRIITSCVCAL